MQVLCLHGPRKSKPRVKSELCKHQFLTTIIWHIEKFMCYCTVLPCFILNLRAISKYKPPRVYIRRVDLTEGFLRYEFRGLIHGGAYFRNFTVFNLYNSENKPRGLYFSKALFERFIFGGAYTAVGGAYLGREICV